MDAIKKKMQSLKTETDNSIARAEQLDAEAREANTRAEKTEENVSESMKTPNIWQIWMYLSAKNATSVRTLFFYSKVD